MSPDSERMDAGRSPVAVVMFVEMQKARSDLASHTLKEQRIRSHRVCCSAAAQITFHITLLPWKGDTQKIICSKRQEIWEKNSIIMHWHAWKITSALKCDDVSLLCFDGPLEGNGFVLPIQ